MPLQIHWVEFLGQGALGMSACPRGGRWLAYAVRDWSREGVSVVVSLLEAGEVSQLGLEQEASVCSQHGIRFVAFPIADRGVSEPAALLKLSDELLGLLQAGGRVVVHCRLGIGRSSVVLASLLVKSGMSAERAFQRIAAARGCDVPDTAEQREWVCKLERQLRAATRGS